MFQEKFELEEERDRLRADLTHQTTIRRDVEVALRRALYSTGPFVASHPSNYPLTALLVSVNVAIFEREAITDPNPASDSCLLFLLTEGGCREGELRNIVNEQREYLRNHFRHRWLH